MESDLQQGVAFEVDRPAKPMSSQENLALLYQGVLTGIVRLQGQRQKIGDPENFRRRIKATLQEVEQLASSAGYDVRDIRDTHFAVVAFLDSVVLHSKDPVRTEWERRTLQEELFGKSEAGVVFFEKLEHFRSRRDSEQVADILEVYLLCLLLGFEGRYSIGGRGDLDGIIQRTRMRMQDIRGRRKQLSPSGSLPENELAPQMQPAAVNHFRPVLLAAAGITVLCFIVCWLLLHGEMAQTSLQLRSIF